MRLLCTLMVAGLACVETGCQSNARASRSPPVPDPARLAGFSAEDISAAGNLYSLKCGKCHEFYDPAQYNDEDWLSWMKKMGKKSRLKPEEGELLSRYLAAFRR